MTGHLSEETQNYLTAVELQLASITRKHDPNDDYDKALGDLELQLRQLKKQILSEALTLSSQNPDLPVTHVLTVTHNLSDRPIYPLPSPPLPPWSTQFDAHPSSLVPNARFLDPFRARSSFITFSSTTVGPSSLSSNTNQLRPLRPTTSPFTNGPTRTYDDIIASYPTLAPKPFNFYTPLNPIPSQAPPTDTDTITCTICVTENSPNNTTTLECCQTVYCKDCFRRWYETSLSAKQLPRCCEKIIGPMKDHGRLLGSQLMMRYDAFVVELEATRKLWCANVQCEAFVKTEEDTSGFVSCTTCGEETCASRAGSISVHKGERRMCPEHLKDEIFETTMVEHGWKRCPKCHVVVEKNMGCNNIRCTCGAMFCFRCGTGKINESDRCECSHPREHFARETDRRRDTGRARRANRVRVADLMVREDDAWLFFSDEEVD